MFFNNKYCYTIRFTGYTVTSDQSESVLSVNDEAWLSEDTENTGMEDENALNILRIQQGREGPGSLTGFAYWLCAIDY